MEPIRIFYGEGLGLFALAAMSLGWRAFFLRNVLASLVRGKQRSVSVVRAQLLVLTIFIALRYLWGCRTLFADGPNRHLPEVGVGWLAALAVSSGVYLVGEFHRSRQPSANGSYLRK